MLTPYFHDIFFATAHKPFSANHAAISKCTNFMELLMRSVLLALSTTIMASTAFAGGPAPIIAEPEPVAPVVMPETSWTGFYLGAAAGLGTSRTEFKDIDSPVSTVFTIDQTVFGGHAGYLMDLGAYVVGGELAVESAQLEDDFDELEPLRITGTVIAGFDAGRYLPYAKAGIVSVSFNEDSGFEDSTGYVLGAGVKYLINDQFMVGAEYLAATYNDYQDTPSFIESTLRTSNVYLSASYRF